jgi:Domain of unknown function (DUF4253)
MNRLILSVGAGVILGAAAGCFGDYDVVIPADRPVTLTEEEQALGQRVAIDDSVMRLAKRISGTVSPFVVLDQSGVDRDAPGVTIAVDPRTSRKLLRDLRSSLASLDCQAYLVGFDRIAIMKGSDGWQFLSLVHTDGVNHGLDHLQVVAKLREWDSRFGIRIIGGSMDWVEVEFVEPPRDMGAFAREVFQFAPDVVTQGTGTVGALAVEIRKSGGVYLWWD